MGVDLLLSVCLRYARSVITANKHGKGASNVPMVFLASSKHFLGRKQLPSCARGRPQYVHTPTPQPEEASVCLVGPERAQSVCYQEETSLPTACLL